jgi:hypothetical protein
VFGGRSQVSRSPYGTVRMQPDKPIGWAKHRDGMPGLMGLANGVGGGGAKSLLQA